MRGTSIVGVERPTVFEPAFKHFARSFRRGEPIFKDPDAERGWHQARRQVMDHLLWLINASPWREHLVLRGSLLLKAWLGVDAREPGDIDWVFRPKNTRIDDPLSEEIFSDLIQLVAADPATGTSEIQVTNITVDDIWTYERVPGRRIVFPWHAPHLPPGEVQMDVVFGEDLFGDPVEAPIPTSDGGGILIWSASKELSLAWKLLWLESDMYPQGKDLYDATLLAEQTRLPSELLQQVFQASDWRLWDHLPPQFPLKWKVDWENFLKEYPLVQGTAEEWQHRLWLALSPTLAMRDKG